MQGHISIEYVYLEDIMQNYFIYKTNGTVWLHSKCTCTLQTRQREFSFHKIRSDSSQTVTDISGKIQN